MESCFICKTTLATSSPNTHFNGVEFGCPRCGYYVMSMETNRLLQGSINEQSTPIISTWLKTHSSVKNPYVVTNDFSARLDSLEKWPLYDKAEALMKWLADRLPKYSDKFMVLKREYHVLGDITNQEKKEDYRSVLDLFGTAQIIDDDELIYICKDYLQDGLGFISYRDTMMTYELFITPKGWNHISEITSKRSGNVCFVAMSFKDKYRSLYMEVIEPAIMETGWKPLCLLNEKPHNDYITNKIIAGIKSARFVVADFTENCYGVYYEAGLAKGLGAEVIHMVREDFINDPKKKVHFDTQQINHLIWKKDEAKESIKQRLIYWIVATVGVGPNIKQS